MRVVPKLTLAFILCTTAVLALNGFLRVEREVAVYEADRTRDHRLMGLALGEAIAAVWRSDGEGPALAVLAHVNTPESRIRVRWVSLEDLASMRRPPVDPKELPVPRRASQSASSGRTRPAPTFATPTSLCGSPPPTRARSSSPSRSKPSTATFEGRSSTRSSRP